MAGPLFVGHPRPVWKVVVLQLVTLGIYGRVWLYRSVKEIDGHKVWFLDLNLYLVGVIVPIGGPLAVKWRLVTLTRDMVAAEVAMPRVRSTALRWAALLPWIPLYHGFVQRHLNRYWVFNRKIADVDARREVLEEQRRTARTPAQREALKELEHEIQERAQAIEAARGAAQALRDAERARAATLERAQSRRRRPSMRGKLSLKPLMAKLPLGRRATDEDVAGGTDARPEPMDEPVSAGGAKTGRLAALRGRLPFLGRAAEPQDEEAAPEETARPARGRKARAAPAVEPEPEPAPEKPVRRKAKEPVDAPAEPPAEASEDEAESFWAKRKRLAAEKKAEKAARQAEEKATEPEAAPEPEKPQKPSRKERKKLKILEKERQRREKERAKEEALHAKLQQRIEKRQAKAAARDVEPPMETAPPKKKSKR